MSVATSSGILQGEVRNGLRHFRGVLYASANRFERPCPVDTPGESRRAVERGPACPQDPSRLDFVTGPVVSELGQSEDCLTLSVTAPTEATNLPVLVWFHGGAYMSGAGEAAKYDPDELARLGAVVVNVTYRLGVFGYLPPYGASDLNLGLFDQIEALRWVRKNATAFGGDPDCVTAFGQSAGADSILALMATSEARGLFQRAILQSTPLGLRAHRPRMMTAMRAAIPPDLFTAPSEDVLAAQRSAVSVAKGFGPVGGMPFGPVPGHEPVVVNDFDTPERSAAEVELLVGHTKDDAAPFVAMDQRAARLSRLGALGQFIRSRIVARMTQRIFGVNAFARSWARAGGRITTYRLDWAPTASELGACHCTDLPLLFSGDWSDAPMLCGQEPPPELAHQMRRLWVDFAARGSQAFDRDHYTFG